MKTVDDASDADGDAIGVSDSDGEEPDKADIFGVGLYVSCKCENSKNADNTLFNMSFKNGVKLNKDLKTILAQKNVCYCT